MKTIAKYLPRSDLCKPISFLLEKNSKKSDRTKTSFRKIGTEPFISYMRTILLTEDEPGIRDTNERRIGDMKMNGQSYFGDV
ncbi:hypothetical protein QMN03_15670 [Leptospira santarosai]|uniref:hypothetical protein n=1 Tax=Leptospira santarosai TaxID=28183 RepID=UPI000303F14F|nr:hypothetical protein [Leptospira santarosai]MDI7208321.1 hypothetical protein [Leptospira santarosai]